jgi:hypothetical protein
MLKAASKLVSASQLITPISLPGDVTLSTGNLVIGTAGKGIDFSITSSGSGTMTSELLADYEEGTFTPTLTAWTIIGAQSHQGFYTKIGRQVTVVLQLNAATSLASTGSSLIGGLPFSVGLTSIASMAVMTDSSGSGSASSGYATGTSIYPGTSSATAYKFLTVTYFTS